MWAITSYFNPARYKTRLYNYGLFRERLALPLVTVELSFDGHFELSKKHADILIQISGGAVIWQKERLLNIALKSVPPKTDDIAWLDCDVIFERSDWVETAKEQLKKFNVIQLFSEAIYVKRANNAANSCDYNANLTAPGIVSLFDWTKVLPLGDAAMSPLSPGAEAPPRRASYQPGLAWAAKRNILNDHGFYDAAIVGGGDPLMVAAMYGRFDDVIKRQLFNSRRREHYLRWANPYHKSVAERVGYVPGRLYHLWHGDLKDRAYVDRYNLLKDFDPETDLMIGTNNVWQWARPRSGLEESIQNYFIERAEDG